MRVTGDDVAALADEVAGSTHGDRLEVNVWRGGELMASDLDVSAWSIGWDADRQVQGQGSFTVADPDGVLAPWGMGDALAPGGSRLQVTWVSGLSGLRVPLGWWRIRTADPNETWRVYRQPGAWSWDVAIRTSLCPNPKPSTLTGWSAIGGTGTAVVADADFAGGTAAETAWNGTTPGSALPRFNVGSTALGATTIVVAPGGVSVSASVKPQVTRSMHVRAYFYDAAGVLTSAQTGASSVCPAGVVSRLSHTGTAPAGTARVLVLIAMDSTTGMTAGETFRAGDLLVEQSATVGGYFDGDTPDTVDTTYRWTGTANASTSKATTTTGMAPAGGVWSTPPLLPDDALPPSDSLVPSDGASGFDADSITRVPGGGTVAIEADEETVTVQLDRLDAEVLTEATCLPEIRRLLAHIMPVTVVGDVPDRAVPADLVYGLMRTDAVGDLLDVLDAACRMGPDGALEIVPAAGVGPVWTIQGGDDGALVRLARRLSDEDVYNAATSTGETEAREPLTGRARILGGPLAWDGPFGRVTIFHNAIAQTQAGVDADAATTLATRSAAGEVDLAVTCLTHPGVQMQDRVVVVAATRAGDQPLEGRVVGMGLQSVTSDAGTVPAKSMSLRVRVSAEALDAVAARVRRA